MTGQIKTKEEENKLIKSQTMYHEFIRLLSEKAITRQQKREFKKKWDNVCDFNGFGKEELKPVAEQFFLLDEEGSKIGTLEVNYFDFNDITKVDYFEEWNYPCWATK